VFRPEEPLPMKSSLMLLALLPCALMACQPTPSADEPAAAPAVIDQPAADIPPANAPPPITPPGESVGDTLARFDGYGDLRFGMSADEAGRAWGGELKRLGGAEDPCYHLTPKWVKVPSDFALMIENGKFVRVDVGNDREVAPGGGKAGMSADEIRKLYAGRIEEQPHKYVEGGKYLRIKDSAGGNGVLVFVADAAGKITAWRTGVPPQVDYVEGCS